MHRIGIENILIQIFKNNFLQLHFTKDEYSVWTSTLDWGSIKNGYNGQIEPISDDYQTISYHESCLIFNVPVLKGQIKNQTKIVSPESETVSWTSLLDLSNESVNNGVSINFTLSQKTFNESFILIKDTVNSCCSLLFHLCQETFTKIWPFLQDFFNGLNHRGKSFQG